MSDRKEELAPEGPTIKVYFLKLGGESADKSHKTVPLIHHAYGQVEVDAGIAPLIQAIWEKGLDTFQCCEGYEDEHAYINMPQADLELLLRILLPDVYPEALWERNWIIEGQPCFDDIKVDWEMIFRFPKKDIAKLTRKVKRFQLSLVRA